MQNTEYRTEFNKKSLQFAKSKQRREKVFPLSVAELKLCHCQDIENSEN